MDIYHDILSTQFTYFIQQHVNKTIDVKKV